MRFGACSPSPTFAALDITEQLELTYPPSHNQTNMSGPSENPHLTALLDLKNLPIIPNRLRGVSQSEQFLEVGQVTPHGTVIGFSMPEGATENTDPVAVIYDESKEGQEDAITTIKCRL